MDSTSQARNKQTATRRYHVLRTVLFAAACVCAVAGMLMLTATGGKQLRSETVTSEAVRAETQANVLLIMSYGDSDVLTTLARKGVVDTMAGSGVAVDVEYMDAIGNPRGSASYKARERALVEKLGDGSTYNAVICCDDEALTFVEDHRGPGDPFAAMPVVFLNVNDFAHARAAVDAGYATGLVEQGDVAKIVALARQLRPDATQFLVVVDDTPSGVGDRAQFEMAVAGMRMRAEYVNASALSRDALAKRVGAAEDDTIVFLLDAFTDVSGATYTRDESARFVAEASRQPVFGIATGGVGEGLLGATFTDPEADGQRAADMCIEVLNGKSPAAVGLVTDGTGGFAFDEAVMQRFGIPADVLPANAVKINQPSFTFGSIAAMLPAIGLLVLAFLLILVFALMGYRHSLQNMREIIAQSDDLRHRFYHDQLTEKPNMQWFKEYALGAGSARVKSLVEVDFRDFSDVNDSYGQAVGDEVLCQFASRFESVAGKLFLARAAGSAFLLGFDHAIARNGAELSAIGALLGRPVVVDDAEIELDAHIGVANLGDARTVGDMATGVDLAVRDAKRTGTANVAVFYDERMKREMEEKIGVTALLKQSIKNESFIVLYQPQVETATGDVCGYEALVRMEGDAYRPFQFVPVAELSGLIIDVDRIVTKKVVQQLADWKASGERMVPVSINFSAVQLRDEEYVDYLVGLLDKHGVAPSYVKIEITESLLLDDEDAADRLFARLTAAGIPVALDDFGTGYTSLSSVATMPAEIVKIDKSLVDEYAVDGKELFLENLIRLVHDLGKKIVVEGVETAEQLQICRVLGCDIVQGYYYSRPLPADEAASFRP